MKLIPQPPVPVKSIQTGSHHPQAPQGQAIAHAAMIPESGNGGRIQANNRLRLTQALAAELARCLEEILSRGSSASQHLALTELQDLVNKR
jgi:hypothetical protein